jgi:hypothetical protein
MLTQVGRKLCKTSVTKYLRGTQDRGCVNVKTLGHFARREKAGLIGGIEDGPDQSLTSWIKLISGFGEARLKSGRRNVSIPVFRMLSESFDLFA